MPRLCHLENARSGPGYYSCVYLFQLSRAWTLLSDHNQHCVIVHIALREEVSMSGWLHKSVTVKLRDSVLSPTNS